MGNRQTAITLLVAGTFFMENLDGTILATAAPSIGRSFGVTSAAVAVTITAYLLTLAVLIPLSGWLSQRIGTRPVFISAIAIFTVASVLCAVSVNLPELTVMRVLQGIGGAMMVPVGRLAVLRVTEKKDLIKAIAWLTWPALAAPVIAPLVGGLITTYASWQWIFLINVPLGAVAFIVALRIIPQQRDEAPAALDWIGLLLTCTGLGSLVYLGSLLADPAPNGIETIIFGCLGVGLTVAAIFYLLRARHPLLDLSALRIETFRVTHAGGSLFRLAISAVPFLLPLFFQDALGWTPVQSGAILLFLFVGNLAIKPATTPLLVRFGFRPVLIVASFCAAASMVLEGLISSMTPLLLVVILLIFGGVARSVGFTGYNTIAFADVPAESMTAANTFSSTIQQVSAGFGVAVGAVALRAGDPVASYVGAQDSSVVPYQFAFFVLAALTLVATVEAILLTPSAGDNIRPARRSLARTR